MRKKIINPKISEYLFDILDNSFHSLSITNITETLKNEYDIKVSPQVVKRHLEQLAKGGKIEQA